MFIVGGPYSTPNECVPQYIALWLIENIDLINSLGINRKPHNGNGG